MYGNTWISQLPTDSDSSSNIPSENDSSLSIVSIKWLSDLHGPPSVDTVNFMRKGGVRLGGEKGVENPVSLPYRGAFLE